MPINVESESLLSFSELAKSLPTRRAGRPVHVSTIHRWRSGGVRGVKLESVRIGGAWCTSWEAFSRFCEKLTAAETGEPYSGIALDSQRSQHKSDEQRLAADGW